ncbi:amidohydrolase family protein [Neomoorella glycerini]|uniref:amidohydrolase family protein n=1 Tax=Neomoorella glycerini TaxID=55779 RepID=UPI001FE31891|nr:amidohydrolase family protein [Moorella glycerini]
MPGPVTILGGFLITSSRAEVHPSWGVRVAGGKIAAIGPNEELLAAPDRGEVIDARDAIISPGFINGHMHMYGILSHGISVKNAPAGFYSFLEDFWWPQVENRLDHNLVATTTAWACVEMIASGITTFCDILEAPAAIPGALEVEAGIVRRAGLRAILSFEACERISQENGELGLKENAGFIRACQGDPLVKGLMSVHTTFTCSPEFLIRASELARELGSDLHMHLSESPYEPQYCRQTYGKRPVEVYRDLNILGAHILASQGVDLAAGEIELLAASGARLVHMPLSNCEVGGGIAPVPQLLAAGVPLGLGTDGYINNFFEVMRGAFLIHKANMKSPQVMPARTVFGLATDMGARALGEPELGRLEPDCPADLITIKADTPTPINAENIFDQIILFRNPGDVVDVMVNGKFLQREGRLLTLEAAKVKAETRDAALAFWR